MHPAQGVAASPDTGDMTRRGDGGTFLTPGRPVRIADLNPGDVEGAFTTLRLAGFYPALLSRDVFPFSAELLERIFGEFGRTVQNGNPIMEGRTVAEQGIIRGRIGVTRGRDDGDLINAG